MTVRCATALRYGEQRKLWSRGRFGPITRHPHGCGGMAMTMRLRQPPEASPCWQPAPVLHMHSDTRRAPPRAGTQASTASRTRRASPCASRHRCCAARPQKVRARVPGAAPCARLPACPETRSRATCGRPAAAPERAPPASRRRARMRRVCVCMRPPHAPPCDCACAMPLLSHAGDKLAQEYLDTVLHFQAWWRALKASERASTAAAHAYMPPGTVQPCLLEALWGT